MDYPWIIHGLSIAYAWIIQRLSRDFPFVIHWLSISPWIIHSLSMDYPEIIHGLSGDYPWIIQRLSMDYPWIIQRISIYPLQFGRSSGFGRTSVKVKINGSYLFQLAMSYFPGFVGDALDMIFLPLGYASITLPSRAIKFLSNVASNRPKISHWKIWPAFEEFWKSVWQKRLVKVHVWDPSF